MCLPAIQSYTLKKLLLFLLQGYAGENGGDDPNGTPPQNRIRSYSGFAPYGGWLTPWSGMEVGYFSTASAFRGLQGENIARLNVIIHEYIHTFNMIDLYDISFQGNGCGGYDIMAYRE